MPPENEAQTAREALDALDRALAGKPHKDDPDFTAAMKCLAHHRDALTAQLRAAGTGEAGEIRTRLGRVNAVVSAVLAGHFPIGPIPWPEIEKARQHLAEIAGEAPP